MRWHYVQRQMKRLGAGGGFNRSIAPSKRHLLCDACEEVNAKRVLELGTYMGISTLTLALTVGKEGKVLTIDQADVNAHDGFWTHDDSLGRPSDLMKKADVESVVEFRSEGSLAVLPELPDDSFDLAFIDSGHNPVKHPDGDLTYDELTHCFRIVRQGGVIVLDDVFPNNKPIVGGGFHCPGPWLALERHGVEYEWRHRMAVVRNE